MNTERDQVILARVITLDRKNLRVEVTVTPGQARRLGMPDDAPRTVPLEITGDAGNGMSRPKIEDLLGVTGGNLGHRMNVMPGSVICCDDARYRDGKLQTSWVRALDNGNSAMQLQEGWAKTFPVGKDRTHFRTNVVFPDAARRVASDDELKEAISECLSADGPGVAEAVVRISNEQGQTLHRRANRYLWADDSLFDDGKLPDGWDYDGGSRLRTSPEDAAACFLKTYSATLSDGRRYCRNTIEVIAARSIAVCRQAASDIRDGLQANAIEETLQGPDSFHMTEIPPDQRLTGNYEDPEPPCPLREPYEDLFLPRPEGPPGDKLMNRVSRLAAERDRSIPESVQRDVNAAQAFLDKHEMSFGYARGTVAMRHDDDCSGGGERDPVQGIAVALVADTPTGIPLAAIATPNAPNAPDYARERAAILAGTRDALLSGTPDAVPPEEARLADASFDEQQTGEPEELRMHSGPDPW